MREYLCENCYRSFKDPVCEECQLRELGAWLADQDYNRLSIAVILRAVKKIILTNEDNLPEMPEGFCIVCNKQHIFSCPYCFNQISRKILKRFHAREQVLENFNKIFIYEQNSQEFLATHKKNSLARK